MKKWFFGIVSLLLSMFIIHPASAAGPSFKDVGTGHWAYSDIEWAANKGLVNGYDGIFKPNNDLTEAQFAVILVRYLKPGFDTSYVDNDRYTNHWAEKYYHFLAHEGFELPGHDLSNLTVREKPIKRIDVARSLAFSQSFAGTTNEVIDWMYTHHLTTGKKSSSDRYVDFGMNDHLKRGQVSAFFKRMDTAGFRTISAKLVLTVAGKHIEVHPVKQDGFVYFPVKESYEKVGAKVSDDPANGQMIVELREDRKVYKEGTSMQVTDRDGKKKTISLYKRINGVMMAAEPVFTSQFAAEDPETGQEYGVEMVKGPRRYELNPFIDTQYYFGGDDNGIRYRKLEAFSEEAKKNIKVYYRFMTSQYLEKEKGTTMEATITRASTVNGKNYEEEITFNGTVLNNKATGQINYMKFVKVSDNYSYSIQEIAPMPFNSAYENGELKWSWSEAFNFIKKAQN
ncbi:hypothetical protein JOC78_002896 [Bacillus ectoiniformans]|uniref:S-layer homology domain-containing protein n=1 Tax=Bacillus ectoiniformans TaxID=1494429 RepID=UPI001957E7AC|nr:S-layer homology domain-containing protein [Bacillus ectoiniformans]MBM7649912.1 hypothetical protein [Bacillus ectoiniformans]